MSTTLWPTCSYRSRTMNYWRGYWPWQSSRKIKWYQIPRRHYEGSLTMRYISKSCWPNELRMRYTACTTERCSCSTMKLTQMIKYILQLIEDFKEFRTIRRLSKMSTLSPKYKSMILSYNKDAEKELNSLIIWRLSEEMLKENVSPEYVRGFRSALTWRLSVLWLKSTL